MIVTLPYPPSTNNLYANVGKRRFLKPEGRQYKATAAALALAAGIRPLAGEVDVKLDVYRPRRAGDLDNTLKIILDSLKGIAWADDAQVCGIDARRYEDKHNPRVVVLIEQTQAVV
jgi:crossover junction endodeoxyribonuclease RusA